MRVAPEHRLGRRCLAQWVDACYNRAVRSAVVVPGRARYLWLAMGITALCIAGCQRHAAPSLVLITLDTTRADVLGPYGGWSYTPSIDRLAREGIVFENALAQAPATGPSVASLLTSKYPFQHGVLHSTKSLASTQVTLAEVLREHRYETAAFVSCSILASRYGFAQGFPDQGRKPDRIRAKDRVGPDPSIHH